MNYNFNHEGISYQITSDADQWTVRREKPNAKDPKDLWRPISYHLRLHHALVWVADYLMKVDPRAAELSEVAAHVESRVSFLASVAEKAEQSRRSSLQEESGV